MNIYDGPIEGIKGVLIYKIGESEFCTDIQYIAAVKRIDEIKQNAGQNYISQIEYNQSVFSIIDLHKIYKVKPIKQTVSSMIILHEMYGKNFCFFVDMVIEIISTDKFFLEDSTDLIPYPGDSMIKYILKFQKREIYMPDFERITKSLHKLNEFQQLM
jgi:chemotaxis signal transduction protein